MTFDIPRTALLLLSILRREHLLLSLSLHLLLLFLHSLQNGILLLLLLLLKQNLLLDLRSLPIAQILLHRSLCSLSLLAEPYCCCC